jgi:ketosteroid isomerase-like protein
MPGSGRLDGRAAIRAYYADWLGSVTVRDVVLSNVKVETSGNLSSGWGHFAITMVPKAGGEPIVVKGRFTEVTVKRGGKWVYLVDHASEDPPPTAATNP